MSRRSFDPKECIGALNNFKRAMQLRDQPFSKETVLTALKNCNLPTNSVFWTVFRNSGIIQETSKGKYMFTSKDPIYIGLLEHVKKSYQTAVKKYGGAKSEKKKDIPEPKESPKMDIQSAIDFLKKQGYKVLLPIGVLYKEM